MNDNNTNRPFKEAVCIDAMRIFDSCSFQECLEDLVFDFEEEDDEIIAEASYIKSRAITVTSVGFVVDAVPFNKGFYTVDITFNFRAEVEVFPAAGGTPQIVYGTASWSKKVILYGSDGATQRFTAGEMPETPSSAAISGCACCSCELCTLPTASVTIAPPMCLDANLSIVSVPRQVGTITITIGIFAVVQLSRPVPLMIPAYDYCMPCKECSADTDSPCELFNKIDFPVNEFFPQGLSVPNCNNGNNGNDSDESDEQTDTPDIPVNTTRPRR